MQTDNPTDEEMYNLSQDINNLIVKHQFLCDRYGSIIIRFGIPDGSNDITADINFSDHKMIRRRDMQ